MHSSHYKKRCKFVQQVQQSWILCLTVHPTWASSKRKLTSKNTECGGIQTRHPAVCLTLGKQKPNQTNKTIHHSKVKKTHRPHPR
jgi:hypothetical protein